MELDKFNSWIQLGSNLGIVIGGSLGDVFGNRFAQAWWAENRTYWQPEVTQIIDDKISTLSIDFDLENIQRIRSRLNNSMNK